ncbi:MAG: Hsp70 family protein [Clostridiales bacterium]|jgi:molecular chaperone DnaK|nr:Hsp70 family protein [Clostridiales bacterium]
MIVGIDLGTSTSEIAYINKQSLPEPIPNHLGSTVTPSVVYINERHEPVVGLEAREKLLLEPENTFMEVKRMMGQDITLTARGKEYTPVQLSSFILRYLADCAETHLKQKIERAVITVPAYFTDRQRRDTVQAGELAGLKVERIINEPTAASLDYGAAHLTDCQNILVYDLGGGTLDVTVLELFEGVADVKSSCGNNALGGKDFDEALITDFINRIERDSKINLSANARVRSRLKDAAESCKIALSDQETYEIDLPFLYTKKNKQPAGFFRTVSRADFEGLIREKIESTSTQINTALTDAGLSPGELDLVLLVGGSTKIPMVSKYIGDVLNYESSRTVDPDMAVVRGAAIQGGIIEGLLDENAIVLTDVCPYSLSTDVLNIFSPFFRETKCDILIRRNTTIPVSVSKIYETASDYQTKVDVSVYQGESEEPEENIFLNKFVLSGLPSAKAGKEKIRVTFSYDLNGILLVTAESVSNQKSASITINTSEAPRAEAPRPASVKWEDSPLAAKYRKVITSAEKRLQTANKGERATYELKFALNELKRELAAGSEDEEFLDELKDDLLEALNDYDEQ